MATIDLTRVSKKIPQLRPLIEVAHSKTQSADSVFTEVMFGDLRCCYLVNADINANSSDLYAADIATMMLPAEFMHLIFDVSSETILNPSSRNLFNPDTSAYIPRDENIFTPLLLFYSTASTANHVFDNAPEFHICHTSSYNKLFPTLGAHGCADITGLLNKTTEHLFYFEGDVLLATMIPKDPEHPDRKPSFIVDALENAHLFLLPFLLSEKMVAYYAVNSAVEGWEAKIKAWYSSSGEVAIYSPMLYNDDLGVFITSDAKRAANP